MTSKDDETRATDEQLTIEDASEKLKAPATRRKVSGVELEARFEEWRSDRREKREARTVEDDARRVRRGLIAVMSAGILALVAASALTGQRFEVEHSDNAQKIDDLRARIEEARATAVDKDLAGKLTSLTQAAAHDAQRVAEAQQRFAQLQHKASTQPDAGNGAPNEATLRVAEHRRRLAPLFSPDSYLAEDQEAYAWTSTTPFDPSVEIDPRFTWYVRYDGTKASAPDTYTWSVETVMPDLEDQDGSGVMSTARVIWLCRDTKTGQVLAWATSTYTYDGKEGLFDDLEVVVTTAGDQHQLRAAPAQNKATAPQTGKQGANAKSKPKGKPKTKQSSKKRGEVR